MMNIAITGEGIVSAIGLDKAQVLQSLRSGSTGIGTMRHLQSRHRELPVGEVKLSDAEMKQRLAIADSTMMSRTALMGMLAIDEALADAHLDGDAAKGKRIVLVSGTTVGGMDITEQCLDNPNSAANLEFIKHHDCGSSTRMMADHFGIFADVTTISTACSSAANAIMLGARLLAADDADIVVVGGTEALSRFHLNGFNSLMILDHEQCRPFDATRAGLNLGEGAAFLVMEPEQAAQARGAVTHAYLTGYGNACDAFHQTASSDNGEGAYLAMREALAMAGIDAADVQYVNAHGTGTPNNDQSESAALKRIFGERMPMVSSTKSFTGHTTSASGSIEAVICLLAMKHRFVPGNLGWANPMPDGITPTLGADGVALTNVVCNSFGFGGNDSSLVFSTEPHAFSDAEGSDKPVKVLARVEINSEEQLADIRKYVKPMESRRMGKLMKSSLLSSLEALSEAGIDVPDAIITGTAYGCLDNSERLLEQIREENEGLLKPTYFMQSTHNTISSNIAIKTQCHGYNVTYTQGAQSLQWAMRDAEMLLRSGRCRTVLVGCHDESTPLFNSLLEQSGAEPLPAVHSIAIVLTCGE